jgi:hypothetical protein
MRSLCIVVLHISVSKAFMATLQLTWVIVLSVRYFCSALTKSVIPRQVFTNVPNTKFNENPPNRRHDGTCGQKDGKDEDNTRFSRYPKRLKCNTPNVRFSTGVSKSSLMFLVQTFLVHIASQRGGYFQHILLKGCQFCGPKQLFRLS